MPPAQTSNHGLNKYTREKCRCDICVDAMRTARKKSLLKNRNNPKNILHGTASAFNSYKCKCNICKFASKIYYYFYRNEQICINSKGLRLLSNKYVKISNSKDVFTHILLELRRDFVNNSKKES